MEIIVQIKSFFFRAMLEGWISDGKKITIPQMPGYKLITYEEGVFRLVDSYCKNPSGKSAGTTTIYVENNPVWFMTYGGFYPKEVAVFVREALSLAYRNNNFYGGRGPFEYHHPRFVYRNKPNLNDFKNFKGGEEVLDRKNSLVCLGFHWYRGMSLL